MDACLVDDEQVVAQTGDFYGGWITSDVVGPFKGARHVGLVAVTDAALRPARDRRAHRGPRIDGTDGPLHITLHEAPGAHA